MHPGHIVLILFALLISFVFYEAYEGHSEAILIGFFAVLGGLLVAWVAYHLVLPKVAAHLGEMSIKQRALASGVLGVGTWAALRGPSRSFVSWLHGPGQPLYGKGGGVAAGLVSLVPSLVALFLLSLGLRWAGTIMELRTYTALSHPEAYYSTRAYPHWSGMTTWRDGWERIPGVDLACNLVDDTPRKRHRDLAALLLASAKEPFFKALESRPPADILKDPVFNGLLVDPEITALREGQDWLGLLTNRKLHAASLDQDLKKKLADLNLRGEADLFFLSEAWQQRVKAEKDRAKIIEATKKESGQR